MYVDGKMDIKTVGQEVFSILEIIKELPNKLYSGAIVNYPKNIKKGNRALMQNIIIAIRTLHQLLKIKKEFNKPDDLLWSYEVAHHAGLSISEEYELLQLLHELQRQEYLKCHLKKVIPVITEMETLKERIQLNGHFKNLSGHQL